MEGIRHSKKHSSDNAWRARSIGPLAGVLLALLCFSHALAAESADLIVGPASILRVISGRDSMRVTVTVGLQDTSAAWANRMWGGDEEYRLTRHVDRIEVWLQGQPVTIPLSAYADLGQPEKLEFLPRERGVGFVIRGGAEGTGYEARFWFKNRMLTRRRVELSEFRDAIWEETKYSPAFVMD